VIPNPFLSTAIRTLPLLWHFTKVIKVKATSAGKLLDSLPGNSAMEELCSGKFNVAYCCD
jgi:hypothetical protein